MSSHDIGSILFVDILRMTQYPGAPFTGDIIFDLVSFFFIPMVFIIFFIYILLGRIVYGVQWLRILIGIALFLFLIVNGWYAVFALLAGPYFFFLIIVLGFVYFFAGHFRRAGAPARAATMESKAVEEREEATREDISELKKRLSIARRNLNDARKNLSDARKLGEPGAHEAQTYAEQITKFQQEIALLEKDISIKERMRKHFRAAA